MAGGSVSLRCLVNQASCGDYHSIKWYKENREARLSISPIETADEGEYKCEITFLDISKNCPVVQLVKLTTLAPPKSLNLSLSTEAGTRSILSNSVVGPFNQGSEISLICSSGGGKPIPQVTWYMNGQPIPGTSSSTEDIDRTGTGQTKITLKVDRKDLGAKMECKATNEAVETPLTSSVQLDVSLRPNYVKISGGEIAYKANDEVRLTCVSRGARPAAVLTWFNGSSLYPHQPAGQVKLENDGTYRTQSTLVFPASRFEDNKSMYCEAKNEVIEYYEEQPVKADAKLVVLYPPVVYTSPSNLTVNMSSEVVIQCTYEANPSRLLQVKWFRNGDLVDIRNQGRFKGGTQEDTTLTILEASRSDTGTYTCLLENDLGASSSGGSTVLNVQYPPSVQIRMQPDGPVSETDARNVSLYCEVMDGNPTKLNSVIWYKNGKVLKKLPNCQSSEALCNVDPTVLLLEKVTRQYHANYSCKGINSAGESPVSAELELQVFYPPGKARIVRDKETVIKGDKLTLTCSVAEAGRPAATQFIWRRGGHELRGVRSASWLIDPVTLETESEISCQAINEVGEGGIDSQSLEVQAPPAFIESLKPYTGYTIDSNRVNLSCRVECSPLCHINWLKDGVPIEASNELYSITARQVPPNFSTNDFESVESILTWNLDNLLQGKLDRETDNANYSCRSTDTIVGPGVSSDTHFRVEYPPDKMYISKTIINVTEGEAPERLVCGAEAYPEANFVWKFRDEVIQTHNVLYFNNPITRDRGGEYVCEATNRHGTARISTRINVMFKPDCEIQQEKYDDELILTCIARSNPQRVTFTWTRGPGGGNQTIKQETRPDGRSDLNILLTPEALGMYQCFANNSVGLGMPCEIDIRGIAALKNISDANIIVIVAVISAVLVAATLVIIIVFMCRKKQSGEKKKCANMADLVEDRKVGGGSVGGMVNNNGGNGISDLNNGTSGDDTANSNVDHSGQPPVHKWPLRPGVHVHVNGLNTLTGSTTKLNHPINGFSYGAKTSRSSSSSGSDWASNTSSNQDLNTDSESKHKTLTNRLNTANGGSNSKNGSETGSSKAGSGVGGTSRGEGGTSSAQSSTRQRKKRNGGDPSKSHASELPTFYENVNGRGESSLTSQQQMSDRARSRSPGSPSMERNNVALGHHQTTTESLSNNPNVAGLASAALGRPRSQQSNPIGNGSGLYAFGSSRSSKGSSRHSAASPASCGIHSAPGASIASTYTSNRGGGTITMGGVGPGGPAGFNYPGRFSTMSAHGVNGGGRLDYPVAGDVDPLRHPHLGGDGVSDNSHGHNSLLIEYSAHVPYSSYNTSVAGGGLRGTGVVGAGTTTDTPILSSLTNQSLLHQRSMELQRSMDHLHYSHHPHPHSAATLAAAQQHRSLDQSNLYSTPLLAEPISPPRQFDSSPQPAGGMAKGVAVKMAKPNRHALY